MTYTCITCGRTVDTDYEPSPGEPTRCEGCFNRAQREFADSLAEGWSA